LTRLLNKGAEEVSEEEQVNEEGLRPDE